MERELLEVAKEVLKTENVDLHKNRSEIEEWDSLTHLQLVSRIEEEFGVEIPVEEVVNINCLADFLNYLEG